MPRPIMFRDDDFGPSTLGRAPAAYANVTFILAGNPNRAAPSGGGISTQIPIPIAIPGVLTVGGGVLLTGNPTGQSPMLSPKQQCEHVRACHGRLD